MQWIRFLNLASVIKTGMALWTAIVGLLAVCLLSGHVNALAPGECVDVNDYDLSWSAAVPANLTELECAMRCMDALTPCHGYHYSNGVCYPLLAGVSWSEKRMPKPLRICLVRPNKKCDPKHFPYAYGRSRYMISQEKYAWELAAFNCEKMGAKLLQLGSSEEFAYISRQKTDHYIIGLRKMYSSLGQKRAGWFWHQSGDPLESFINWAPGSPDNYNGDEVVGELFPKMTIDDRDIAASRIFICECHVI